MTKNYARKRAARALQQANPELTRPEATRLVKKTQGATANSWRRGQIPWMRAGARRQAGCYFCGRATAIVSLVDEAADTGRISMYCDNSDCAARDFEVIVVDDGTAATRGRTDVRIMAHFNSTAEGPAPSSRSDQDWSAGMPPHARTSGTAALCLFCGQQSNCLSDSDIAGDHGRIRLRCTNSGCAVSSAEVLLIRDATRETSTRGDVTALRSLEPVYFGRPKRGPGELDIFTVQELEEHASQFDVLQLRTSAPVPWE